MPCVWPRSAAVAKHSFGLSDSTPQSLLFKNDFDSGKTTIINLVMRFFDPQQGSVRLDGVDLRDLSTRTLRKHIALVEQDPLLFRMSIRDNIAYGHPTASEADVVAAARAANIHEFVAGLPGAYRTVVGERGVTISGGERQRLCLARAIVRNPTVLLLDEATSALDSNSEQLIQESLALVLRDKTAIIIAHRLATVQHVDRIVVLDGGRIIDQGRHAELLARCSLYRELAQHQMLQKTERFRPTLIHPAGPATGH